MSACKNIHGLFSLPTVFTLGLVGLDYFLSECFQPSTRPKGITSALYDINEIGEFTSLLTCMVLQLIRFRFARIDFLRSSLNTKMIIFIFLQADLTRTEANFH